MPQEPPPVLTFDEFAARYCARQEQTSEGLRHILQAQKAQYQPQGWFLLQAADLSSSWRGSLVILPYGPRNFFQQVPERPVSPRGLASDMSVVVAVLPAAAL